MSPGRSTALPTSATSTGQAHRTTEALEDALVACLGELLSASRRRAGHWGGVRATADALLCLGSCVPADALPGLRASARDWLISRRSALPGEAGSTWEGEVWDSALALLALGRVGGPEADEARLDGTAGLLSLFQADHGNWNDEPWETSWALLALVQAEGDGLPLAQAEAALGWLVNLVDRPGTGLLVNWHYSALFLLVDQSFRESGRHAQLAEASRAALDEASARVRSRLLDDLARATSLVLWTEEAWSNGLVLMALGRSGALAADTPGLEQVARWIKRVGPRTLTVEDLAFACLGLFEAVQVLRRGEAEVRLTVQGAAAVREALAAGWERAFAQALQRSTWTRLATELPDHQARQPLLSLELPRHYTLRLPRRATNVILVVALSAMVALFSSLDALGLPPRVERIGTGMAVGLGALFTVLSAVDVPVLRILGIGRRTDEAA